MSLGTAIKRAILILAAAAVLAPALQAQWREESARLIGRDKNYAAAGKLLQDGISGFEQADKADAAVLLAFCANRTGDTKAETGWIVDYFDSYKAADGGFAFLDLVAQSDVIGFLNGWRAKYPWMVGVSLVKGVGNEVIMPEGILPLVVEMINSGYFKFSENGIVLKAGQFSPGFNIIALDANALFLGSGRHIYRLEVKSGSLLLSREIALDVEVSSTRPQPAPVSAAQSTRPLEYTLTLYIGGEPVMVSRKTVRPVSLKIDVKPSKNPFGFKPDYMLNRDKPDPMNSFSLFNAIGLLYSLLKDLLKKRGKKDVEPPKIETVQDLALEFRSRDFDGVDYTTRVSLKLATTLLPFAVRPP